MLNRVKFLLAILFVSLLAACATSVPKIDSTPAKLAPIKTIAVIRSPEPKTFAVMNFGHPGMAFGLIGGLIAAGDQSSKQERLSDAFKAQGFAIGSSLATKMSNQLTRIGYEAHVEDGPWEEVNGRYKIAFEKIHSDADAVLVVSPTIVGFVATTATADYLPTITSIVTLLAKDRKEPLYRGYYASGWQPKADGWKGTPAAATFSNFDALMADTTASAASLENAASSIAVAVAADMKR